MVEFLLCRENWLFPFRYVRDNHACMPAISFPLRLYAFLDSLDALSGC